MSAVEVTHPPGRSGRPATQPLGDRARSGWRAARFGDLEAGHGPRTCGRVAGEEPAVYATGTQPGGVVGAAALDGRVAGAAPEGSAGGAVPFGAWDGMERTELLGVAAALVEQFSGDAEALVEVAGKAVARLAVDPLGGETDDGTLAASIEALYRLETQVAAEKTRRMGAASRRDAERAKAREGSGRQSGRRESEDLWQQRLNLTPAQARKAARTAAGLAKLPRTAALFAAGEVGEQQAAAAAAEALEVPAEALDELDELVARHAPSCDVRQLRRRLAEFRAVLDERYLADKEQAAWQRRKAWIGDEQRDGATRGGFRLDAYGAAVVKAALAALARPHGAADARSRDQRMADALVKLCERALDAGDLPEVAAQRPHVIVTVPQATVAGAPGAPPALLDGVGPVSSATARMLACDGEVSEVVVDARGRPLQVKETGKPTGKQRRAVIARDQGCIGCGAPASWCQVHHIVWRRNSGATVVDNLVLACWRCHRNIHHAGWQVVKRNGRFSLSAPNERGRHAGGGRRSSR